MIGENWQLVTHEPVEVADCRKIVVHFSGIFRIYPNLIKENRMMSTWNWLDLQTLWCQPVMPKNLLADRWMAVSSMGVDVMSMGVAVIKCKIPKIGPKSNVNCTKWEVEWWIEASLGIWRSKYISSKILCDCRGCDAAVCGRHKSWWAWLLSVFSSGKLGVPHDASQCNVNGGCGAFPWNISRGLLNYLTWEVWNSNLP